MRFPRANARTVVRAGLLLALALVTGCGDSHAEERDEKGRIVITYWEKWTNYEKDAMTAVVDRYNASQDKVFVRFVSTSQMDRKLLLATAGGNPPDVAGFWSHTVVNFADRGAIIPLDKLMERDGISKDQFIPAIVDCCEYRGFVWGLPTTPATMALHYNKKMFRDAGLDPERPPQTIAELDEYARKLTKTDADGNYTHMGFLPTDPGWWGPMWSFWFDGNLVDQAGTKITANSDAGLRAYKWFQSYTKDYGTDKVLRFEATYRGQFASPSNSFMSERVAMQLQGVWMAGFIEEYGPDVEWAVAPFPAETYVEGAPSTVVECDMLVIPRGARHVEEAWDFIKFVEQQKNMEDLCAGQLKFSPLKEVSEDFYAKHPNPFIKVFRELAESPNAKAVPDLPVWVEYRDELAATVQTIWAPGDKPADVPALLAEVTNRIQPKLDRANTRWESIKATRLEEWTSQ